jgi:superfamily II DNA or RNA helicase
VTPDEIQERLRPHQVEPAKHLSAVLAQHRSGVDLSDTGTGKTYVTAAVAANSRLPTLVVCPKIARSTWTRAAEHFGEKFSVVGYEMLRTGNTPFGKWSNGDAKGTQRFKCTICQCFVDLEKFTPCYAHPRGIHCLETKKRPANYGHFTFHPGVKQIIFDEVHRCSGVDSWNAEILIAAKRQGIRTLGLSATAACNPLGMRALGYMLDLHNLDQDLLGNRKLPHFYKWAMRYGCRQDPAFRGWKWMVGAEQQRQIMLDIRSQILPDRGVRVSWKDIPGFPDRKIDIELYDLDDPEAINSAYKEMAEALGRVDEKVANYLAPESPLSKIMAARQRVEILKVPIFKELGDDYLAKGFSVVFFVNFRATIDELAKRFPDFPIIDGSTESVKHRDEYVQNFEKNQCPGLIVNCDAGSECLNCHDLDGFHPRVGLVSLGFSATKFRQLAGRLHRDAGKSLAYYKVVLAAGTVETKIRRAVAPKLDNLDSLNDADLSPENLKIV